MSSPKRNFATLPAPLFIVPFTIEQLHELANGEDETTWRAYFREVAEEAEQTLASYRDSPSARRSRRKKVA